MKTSTILPALIFLAGHLLSAQANVSMPTAPKAVATREDCHSQLIVLADGTQELVDCSGKKTRVAPKEIEPPAKTSSKTSQADAPQTPLDLDPETRLKEQEALRAQFDYQTYSYVHAKRTFDFQYWSGEIIFWGVLIIVFTGLVFSGVQFYMGLRHPLQGHSRGKTTALTPADSTASEFEASVTGIKLKSSVVGLIILAMSMVFFYLYLKYVYPITNISQ